MTSGERKVEYSFIPTNMDLAITNLLANYKKNYKQTYATRVWANLVHYPFAVALAIRAGADNWQLYMWTLCLQEHMYAKSGRTVSVKEGEFLGTALQNYLSSCLASNQQYIDYEHKKSQLTSHVPA